MKTKLIILFLIGLNFEIFSQSLKGYSPDYILDVRISNIIKDFYLTKGYSKVISVTFGLKIIKVINGQVLKFILLFFR